MTQEQAVPSLRFSGFNDEWNLETLDRFFTFKNGVNADKSAYGQGHKFINVLDIISDIPITYENILDSVTISDDEFKKNEVLSGDILFQRSSETREEVGQSNVYVDKSKPATFGGFVIRGRPIKEQIPEYFHYLLKTAKARKDMTSRSGGSTRYNIGQDSLSDVSVNVAPTLDEQQKIANFLGAVDEKIVQLQKKKDLLEDYKKGCMQKLFSQEIRFTDDNGNSFPEWEDRELGELLGYQQPTNYLVSSTEYSDEYKTPVLTAGKTFILGYTNETEGVFSENLPTIIFDDFTTAFHYVDFPFKAKSSAMKMLTIKHDKDNINYIHAAMTQIEFALGEHKRYWISEYQNEVIPYPCPDEQKKIADFLSALDNKTSLVSDELDKAKTFKKGLLQQMFV